MKAQNPRFLDEQTDQRIRSRFTDPGERQSKREEIRRIRREALAKEEEIRRMMAW